MDYTYEIINNTDKISLRFFSELKLKRKINDRDPISLFSSLILSLQKNYTSCHVGLQTLILKIRFTPVVSNPKNIY